MTYTNWINQTGNWTTAADWSVGEPNALLDAYMSYSGTPYILTLSTAAQAHSLAMAGGPNSTFSETATGSLVSKGGLVANSGTVILDGANAFGSVNLNGATMVIGNANALGFAALATDGGLLTNDVTVALDSDLDLSGYITVPVAIQIAAAHATTFTVGGADGWSIDLTNPVTLDFGVAGSDGTVVWRTGASSGFTYSGASPSALHIAVDAGVLKAGDSGLGHLLGMLFEEETTVAAGATLDLAGFDTTVYALLGAGKVTSAAPATLTLANGATFAGQITGALSVAVESEVLSGANSYTGATTILAGGILYLGAGGTTGTIAAASAINNSGDLIIEHSNTVTLANAISGAGFLDNEGTGTLILTHANTYSETTQISRGAIEAKNATALGTGALIMSAATKFFAGVNFVLPSTLDIYGGVTLAAAAGTTLATSSTHPWDYHTSAGTLTFGSGTFTGAVLWNTPSGYQVGGGGSYAINIAGGTLKAGDDSFYRLTDNAFVTGTTVGAAGVLDAAGHPMAITNLRGSGTIEDTGAATTLNFAGGVFSGKINGALTPYLSGAVSLTGGLGSFTASLTVYSGSVLTLAGASAHNYVLANNTSTATTVILAAGAAETGKLHGYGANDTLDMRGVVFAHAVESFTFNATPTTGGILKLTDGTHTETIKLAGDYTGASFMIANDGHNGTDVTVAGAIPAVRLASAMAAFAPVRAVAIRPPSFATVHGSEWTLAVRTF